MAAVVLSAVSSVRSSARDAQRIAQLRQVQTALEMYYMRHGSYPAGPNSTSFQTCGSSAANDARWRTPLNTLVQEGFIAEIPLDPLNNMSGQRRYCYDYVTSNSGNSAVLCDGVRRTDYEYAIVFSLENPSHNAFTKVTGSYTHEVSHCVVGERVN